MSERLYREHDAPSGADGCTFIFFNALTGDTGMWQAAIGPALRAAGHGTLAFNYRGQKDSPFDPAEPLTAQRLVADAVAVMQDESPQKPVLVGLSIGGLFAAQAILEGSPARGLVLVNTLRRDGPRLKWINDALVRCAQVGGLELFRDLFVPLLFNEDWLAANRDAFLKPSGYTPLAPDSANFHLLQAGGTADWDQPWERLELPTLVITGLQDHVFLDRDDVEALAARLPQCRRLDLADAGHMVPAERPEALIQALLDLGGEL